MSKDGTAEQDKLGLFRCRDVLLVYHRKTGFWGKLWGQGKESRPVPVYSISSEGLCFFSRDEFKVGTQLGLTINLGARAPKINVEAEAVSCGQGKGRYPYRVNAVFMSWTRQTGEILRDVELYCKKRQEI